MIPLVLLLVLLAVSNRGQTQGFNMDRLAACDFGEWLGDNNIIVGAMILNFTTGRGCIENIDVPFQVASVPKLFVAGAYYEAVAQGRVSPNTPNLYTDAYWMGGRTDCLTDSNINESFRTRELLDMMIACSDNAATWLLMDAVGWGRIQTYIDSLGIDDIGEVIPYSEVDRRKLTYLDARWADVPRGMASRFYRARITTGLVPRYFNTEPTLSRNDFRWMNTRYINDTLANTITPRAMAEYLLKLRTDYYSSGVEQQIAWQLFGSMMQTQRQHSAQAFPGTVFAGAKNGFDTGLTAEVNMLFATPDSREPQGMAIIFTQQLDLYRADTQTPGRYDGTLNVALRRLSPVISRVLYPDYVTPDVSGGRYLSSVVFQTRANINRCWNPYERDNFSLSALDTLEGCIGGLGSRTVFNEDEPIALVAILRGLSSDETRLVYVYTAPDGRQFSYQDRHFAEARGIYWIHPPDSTGPWTIDIFVEHEHIYRNTVQVIG